MTGLKLRGFRSATGPKGPANQGIDAPRLQIGAQSRAVCRSAGQTLAEIRIWHGNQGCLRIGLRNHSVDIGLAKTIAAGHRYAGRGCGHVKRARIVIRSARKSRIDKTSAIGLKVRDMTAFNAR